MKKSADVDSPEYMCYGGSGIRESGGLAGRFAEYDKGEHLPKLIEVTLQGGYKIAAVLCVVRSGHHFNYLSTGAVDTGRHMNQCTHSPLGEISALRKFMLLSPEQIGAHHLHMKDARLSRQRRYRGSKRGSKLHREWQQSEAGRPSCARSYAKPEVHAKIRESQKKYNETPRAKADAVARTSMPTADEKRVNYRRTDVRKYSNFDKGKAAFYGDAGQ